MRRPHLESRQGYLHIAFYVRKYDDNKKLILDKNGKPKWFRKTQTTKYKDNPQDRSNANLALKNFNGETEEAFVPTFLSEMNDLYKTLFPNKDAKSLAKYHYAVNSFIKYAGDRYMHTYTIQDTDIYIAKNLKKLKAVTVHSYVRHLKTLFNRALKYHYIKKNVFKECIRIDLDEPEHRCFEYDEFDTLLQFVDSEFDKDMYTFYVYSGLRLSELRRLELVKIDDRFLHITKTKTKKERYVEIHDKLQPIIKKYRKTNIKYLFEQNGKQFRIRGVQDRLADYLRKAGLDKKLTIKSMRKTFGSWLLDNDVSIEFISNQMGNSVAICMKHYAKFFKRNFKGYVNQMP